MSGPAPLARLPFGPLDRLLAGELVLNWRAGWTVGPFLSALIAELAGVNRASVARWRASGGIPEQAADRVACALGRHPSNVWGDAWWQLAAGADEAVVELVAVGS